MRIRMLLPISGQFHGHTDIKRGDIIEVDDENAVRYCSQKYAEPAGKAERAVETATANQEFETAAVEAVADPQPVAEAPAEAELPKALDEEDESAKSEDVDEADESTESSKRTTGTGTRRTSRR